MTQQLSMERAELERAKVRWGRHLQGCTALCGGGKSWVLGCSILLQLSASSASHRGNRSQASPLAHGCRRPRCVRMARAGS